MRETCDEDYNTGNGDYDDLLLFEIPIPAGVAIRGDLADGENDIVCWYTDAYRRDSGGYNDEWEYVPDWNLRINDENLKWKGYYYPVEDSSSSWSAFFVDYEFETMSFSYCALLWTGGYEYYLL